MVSEDPIRSPESNDSKSGRPASLTEVDDEIGKTIDDENMETGMVSRVQGFLFFKLRNNCNKKQSMVEDL